MIGPAVDEVRTPSERSLYSQSPLQKDLVTVAQFEEHPALTYVQIKVSGSHPIPAYQNAFRFPPWCPVEIEYATRFTKEWFIVLSLAHLRYICDACSDFCHHPFWSDEKLPFHYVFRSVKQLVFYATSTFREYFRGRMELTPMSIFTAWLGVFSISFTLMPLWVAFAVRRHYPIRVDMRIPGSYSPSYAKLSRQVA